jgi:hypothetical protein
MVHTTQLYGAQGFFYALSQFVVAKPVIAWSAARGEWASLRVPPPLQIRKCVDRRQNFANRPDWNSHRFWECHYTILVV